MREQAQKYGARIERGHVTRSTQTRRRLFTRDLGLGLRRGADGAARDRASSNRRPPMDEELHDEALARGLIRYCPICDGYEVTDKKVGVIGSDSRGVAEAIFLRSFTADVTLIAPDKALTPDGRGPAEAEGRRNRLLDGPAQAVAIAGDCIVVETAEGTPHLRQRLSGARAATPIRSWPSMLGARLSEHGLHRGRRPSADQRPGSLRGGRRRDRPRPDQPRHGRRRRRRDDHPQRPGQGSAAAAARASREVGHARSSRRDRGRPRGRRCRSRNGISERRPFASSISRMSPAPKFSTATTVPTAWPFAVDAGRPIRSA